MKTGLILLGVFVFLSIVVIRALKNAPVIDDMDENEQALHEDLRQSGHL